MDCTAVWFPFGLGPADGSVRLFCLPYAGAGASAYAGWLRQAPDGVGVVPVQLPGREHRVREVPGADLRHLVEGLAAAMGPVVQAPYALFGHSMGALVAFELSRSLRRHGHPAPAHVFVSGRGAPDGPAPGRELHRLSDREFIDEIGRLDGTPPALLAHPEFRSLFLPVLRADFTAVETYRYTSEPPLEMPFSVFGGTRDTILQSALEAWRTQTTGTFQLRMLEGGHFFLHDHRASVLRAIGKDLARVQ